MAPNQLLAAADLVASTLPTSEIGSVLPPQPPSFAGSTPSWSVLEAQQRSIPVDALRWPFSVVTYEAMRRDTQIQGLLLSVFLPLRHMRWYLDPTDAPASLVEEISEDLGLPIGDDEDIDDTVGFDFDDHLRQALLALAIGHRFFEESGQIIGSGSSAKYRLTRLADRPPSTLSRISVAASGDLVDIQQTGMLPVPIIPADRLVAYVWDREGGNWAGRPLLYGLYRAWFLKDELVRADVATKRRFGGIPVVETTDQSAGPAEHAKAAEMAEHLQSGDGAGAALPFGTRLRLLGVEGSVPDAIASAQYHDQQMARAFMQMFAELGQNAHGGSRALGTTLMDHYALGVLAVAKWTRKPLMQLVRRIAIRNYGADVKVPQVRFRQDDHEDITATDMVALIDAGAIVVDDELEATIRERSNLPKRDTSEPGRTVPGTTPAPAARRRKAATAAATPDGPAAQSKTDFADLQATYETALAKLEATWRGVQAGQIADLHRQISEAKTVEDLAQIAPPVVGAAALTAELQTLIAHGAQSVIDAAAAQGATVASPDLAAATAELAAAVTAKEAVLASALGVSASSKAVSLAGPNPDMAQIADDVRDYLHGLTGTTPAYELGGLVSHAQNAGRFAAMAGAPAATRFYASALNDEAECEMCAEEDETEFASLDEAQQDFPSGGYVGCLGGERCRCTVVAVFNEAAPSA